MLAVVAIAAIRGGTVLSACGLPTTARSLPAASTQSACRQLEKQQFEQAASGGYTHLYDTSVLVNTLQSSGNELLGA